jgi:hypothetical protein
MVAAVASFDVRFILSFLLPCWHRSDIDSASALPKLAANATAIYRVVFISHVAGLLSLEARMINRAASVARGLYVTLI